MPYRSLIKKTQIEPEDFSSFDQHHHGFALTE